MLGHVLARAAGGAGGAYAAMLAERVTDPLGLAGTDWDSNRPQATGHWHGRARPALLMPGLAAAGAVRSSARDLLGVLAALLDPDAAPGRSTAPPLRGDPGFHRVRGLPPRLGYRTRRVDELGPHTARAVRPGRVRDPARTGPAAAGSGVDRSGVKHDRLRRFTAMVLPRCVTGLTFSSYASCLRA
ncbi:serine hydrolase [Streptomyces sp. NBC_00683]|uniref:serine hydrolase n=1 Tax=Streptomyces sp. NBC_00683 TaxID=2903670 RepID=UPI003FA78352